MSSPCLAFAVRARRAASAQSLQVFGPSAILDESYRYAQEASLQRNPGSVRVPLHFGS